MPTKKAQTSQSIYQLKIALRGTNPPIWRRLRIPSDITFARLHQVLQIVMGWQDCHLHEFEIGKERIGVPDPEGDFMGMAAPRNERRVTLFEALDKGMNALYTYDFGDTWDHTIRIEKVLAPEPGVLYPVCTDGALAAPPEDCGGITGYYNLLDVLADPDNEEHEEMREWAGDFDPTAFSIDQINRMLGAVRRRVKT